MKVNINQVERQNKEVTASLHDDDDDEAFSSSRKSPDSSKSKTPILDSFGKDLTRMAEEGKLDPVVGRDKVVERVSQILSRRKKNNPVIIGDPGSGKTSIVDLLAQRIAAKKCSRVLFNKRIYTLDMGSMVSGTKYRGQFEERMKALMTELEKNPDIILFVDEIHTMVGAGGSSGSLDASNMFKPALSRGEIQIIGATTIDEYRKHIEKDGALERRFQKVQIDPSTPEETIQILNNIKSRYEEHHNVVYTKEAIDACVNLSVRYIQDRHLPDKAIDCLDEAGSRIHLSNITVPKEITDIENKIVEIKEKKGEVVKSQKYEEAAKLRDVERQLQESLEKANKTWEEESKLNRVQVTEDHVAEVVSMMSGVPVTKVGKSENQKLSGMYDSIKDKVIGQDDAVRKITKAIQRSRIGLKDHKKPVFSGLLIGNSGVGKTELAKQLAKYMFDSEDALIRFDMSEFSEKIAITRLFGAAPGYVGFESGGELTEKVRTKPYSVLLFDEIEKAHPDIFNVFLQMLDDGQLTDSHGRKVSFKNCVILMTSNVGTRIVKDFGAGVGFQTKSKSDNKIEDIKSILEKELKKKFAPEFINRLDEIIYFNDLNKDAISQILDLELSKVAKRLDEIEYPSKFEDSLKEHLMDVGYDPSMGARPMKRAIQKWIDDPITEEIIDNDLKPGTSLTLSYDKESNKTVIKFKKAKAAKSDKKEE